MSDDEIDRALEERERRERARWEQPSPAPWTAKVLMVVDANGVEICNCGGMKACYDGNTPRPERGIANARHCAVGPDGVALARLIVEKCEGRRGIPLAIFFLRPRIY
jgi:hypothetical protein